MDEQGGAGWPTPTRAARCSRRLAEVLGLPLPLPTARTFVYAGLAAWGTALAGLVRRALTRSRHAAATADVRS